MTLKLLQNQAVVGFANTLARIGALAGVGRVFARCRADDAP